MAVSSAEDCPLTQEACPYISLHTRRVLIWVSHWMSSLYFDLYGNHLRTFFTVGVLCVVFFVLCLFTGFILSCPTPLICSLLISVSGWRCTCTRHLMTWKFSWKQKAERRTLWGGIFFFFIFHHDISTMILTCLVIERYGSRPETFHLLLIY